MLFSYFVAKIHHGNREDVSFEDWVVKRYGQSLYETFFEPYTEKVWGIPCRELSAEWAAHRIGIPSMWRAIRYAIRPPESTLATTVRQFYYPREGFGMFPAALARDIWARGGRIHTETRLSRLEPLSSGMRVTVEHRENGRQSFDADAVVSTIPLNYLLEAIPRELGSREVLDQYGLEYRDIICLFLALNREKVSDDSWTYFPERHLIFGRTHEPKNWSREMVPGPDYTSLCVEIFSSRGEEIWNMSDQEICETVVGQMDRIGWISRRDLMKWWMLRVPYAYPVYRVGYGQKLQRVKEYLAQWPHLHLVGRTGSFRYMNSDGVVEDVFRFLSETDSASGSPIETIQEAGRWM